MIYFDADKIRMVLETPHGRMNNLPHSRIIYRMLQAMYNRQTSLERQCGKTITDNGMGFNGYDADFLSDVARSSMKYNDLTRKQSEVVAKKLKKYIKQLVEIANEHQPEQAPLPKKSKKQPEQLTLGGF